MSWTSPWQLCRSRKCARPKRSSTKSCSRSCSGPIVLGEAKDHYRLEVEFHSQLTLSGPDSRIVDHAEVGFANVGIRRAEHWMVEGIRCLQAQFQLHSFVATRESEFL